MSKILIVDDALFMRKMIRDALEPLGYEIAGEGQDGREALDLYEETHPDLTTLDIIMPGMDGLETLRELRKRDPEAKVIMITAVDQKPMMQEAMRLGVSDFIVKPFDDTRVVSAIQKALCPVCEEEA